MIGNPDFDEFVAKHRWTIITTLRKGGHPSSSLVAYAREGDQIVISTRAPAFKVKTLERDPRVTLCIINNDEPFNFVEIEGSAVVERSNILDATRAVFRNIAEAGWNEPPDLAQWMMNQQRVIIRVTPDRVSGVIRPRR